jgi:type IV pilus assembly protein PilC
MARFAFEARDRQGRVVRGTREAESAGALAAALQERALSLRSARLAPGQPEVLAPARAASANTTPSSALSAPVADAAFAGAQAAAPSAGAPPAGPAGGGGAFMDAMDAGVAPAQVPLGEPAARRDWVSRAGSKSMALYWKQMHALLHAGSSLSHALAVAARHDASPVLRRVSEQMSRATSRGTPWSEAMVAHPGLFSDLAVGLIAAGESAGRIDHACARLSEYAERDYNLQQAIKRETWYPKLLVACAIFIPSVVPLVLRGGAAWWDSVRPTLFVVLAVVLLWKGVSWLAPMLGQSQALARVVDRVKLSLPVFGKVTRGLAASKLCRALGATLGAGVPVNRALTLAGGACGNAVLQDAVERARLDVLRGDTLTGALSATRQFPPVAMQMLAVGEASGQTEEQLDKVADFLEGDAETAVKQSVKLLGVLVLLLVAYQIGSQIVSFYSGFYGGAESLLSDI